MPNSCCTDSLIPIGKFDTLEEAINLQMYLKTRFVRYMISILKVSQNLYQNVYQFVPLQDFTNKSDLNYKESIDNLDEQLFDKYNISSLEIEHINEHVSKVEY